MNQKIKIITLIFGCILLLFLMLDAIVLAQGHTLEIKIPHMPETVTLPQYLRGIFIFGLAAVGITAMASIMLGGIRYMASDLITTKQDAKDQISSAIYGLLLLLFSYLILNTINPELVSLEPAKLEPQATTQVSTTQKQDTKQDDSKTRQQHEEVYQRLIKGSAGKITLNADYPKTSLAGLRQEAVTGILLLRAQCQCNIVISGGTEPGKHIETGTKNHINGYKLDVKPNDQLNKTILSKIKHSCGSTPKPNTNCHDSDGNVYRYEINHWDICFKCR